MKIKSGDLVSVNGERNTIFYGEIIGKNEFGKYEVYFITENNGITTYDEHYHEIDKESIMIHVPNQSDYVNAWSQLGFHYEPKSNLLTPIPHFVYDGNTTEDELYTGSSSEETHSLGSMDSWSSSDCEDDYTEEDKQFLLE